MEDLPQDTQTKHQLDVQHQVGGPFVQAVDTTSMAMIVTDCHAPNNPIIFANDAFLRLSGYERSEVLGKNYRLLYGRQTDPQTEQKIEQALSATGDITTESLLYRKDGQGIWVLHHVAIQDDNGKGIRHFASFFDIDRRVRAEREVRNAHDLLEERVKRRTRQLSRLVEELRRENQRRLAAEDVLRHTLDDKERLLQQRELLVREVNHRVKNTLQMASALLTIQAGTTTEPAVAAGLDAAIRRLERLAEVHRLLYLSADVGLGVSLDTYLEDLCHHLIAADERAGRDIQLKLDIEDGLWLADEAIPIALIVNEAVTNALKHAFPGARPGTITVRLGQVNEGVYELVIADNGVGGQTPSRPGALGMKLIDTFARQLGAILVIDHDRGTGISLRFPHQDRDPQVVAE